jgi:molybdopterin-containing oxidoreductase family membrane subunit
MDSDAAAPVIGPGHTYRSVTEKISAIVLHRRTGRGWMAGFALAFFFVLVFFASIAYVLARGVGVWGINVPVAWGFAIVNFVWWIGIGHAGTLISAVLLLLHQEWRTSINRFAESMTLFAVTCAGIFPVLHLGRPWYFYWLAPYPNVMSLWPQFRSPLVWDLFAVLTYFAVSLLFWYVGLIPDLATLRDVARNRFVRVVYGVLAMGWRGSAVHWHRYHVAYVLLAGLATPLVVSVHSVVSLDFAAAQIPGWHATVFPPYFVAGAIFSGFSMVLTLAIPVRKVYGLEDFITTRHLDNMGKVLLASGCIVAYGYCLETFMTFYGGDVHEIAQANARFFGPSAWIFWSLIASNVVIPQLLWLRGIRRNARNLFLVALVINVGMWLERYVIVVLSLERSFVPSEWGSYRPTFWDVSTLLGSIGLFAALFLLFIRLLPMISAFEMRELVASRRGDLATESAEERGRVPE